MNIIAIIPARGSNKSTPYKNTKLLAGKPMIAYSIETALKCPLVDRVVVSTDDIEIAAVARKYGAQTPFMRPKELAQDETPMLPVLQHAVDWLEKNENEKIDIVVLLDATTPFRTSENIEECIKKLQSTNADSVITVCEAEHNPYFVMVQLDDDKMQPLLKTDDAITRRQDAPKVYRINAGVYAIKKDVLMQQNKIFTDNTRVVIMPQRNSVHIDNSNDFELAEFLAKKKAEMDETNKMKFLVIGLGSMGKRRIRNLKYLRAGEITGFDTSAEKRKEAEDKYGIKTFETLEGAINENPDAFVISTPPDSHLEFALLAAKNNKHFFTEVNVPSEDISKLVEAIKGKDIVAAPSSTLRFNSLIKKMKSILDEGSLGKPLSFTYHCGQYLPDWHPWEDYRGFYVSRKETGACREMIVFELSWIKWMFGDIKKISCIKDKLSSLETQIDDVYQTIMKFDNGIMGHVLIDVVSRVPYREFKLLCEKGVIIWDWTNRVLKVFSSEKGQWEEYHEKKVTPETGYIAGEEMYIEEMKTFIDAIIKKEDYGYTFEEESKIINTLYAAEKSSDQGVHEELK
ncbi:MAG: Gfo/Idh/MocA family oxidoreductase [Candidatus Aenigmatarchaeota archaeon]